MRIFINYRRDDNPGFVHALSERLGREFSSKSVILDVDTFVPGEDFVEALQKKIGQSNVFLVVIGSSWLNAKDSNSNLRIENEKDFVRIEIELALKLKKRIIPVLLQNASMPTLEDLPASISTLTRVNAIRLTHERFSADVSALIKAIKDSYQLPPLWPIAALVVGIGGYVTGTLIYPLIPPLLPKEIGNDETSNKSDAAPQQIKSPFQLKYVDLFENLDILYWVRAIDGDTVTSALKKLDVKFRTKNAVYPEFPTDLISCTNDVPLEAIKLLAYSLIEAGVPLRSIATFDRPGWTRKIIIESVGLGVLQDNHYPIIKKSQIDNMKSCSINPIPDNGLIPGK